MRKSIFRQTVNMKFHNKMAFSAHISIRAFILEGTMPELDSICQKYGIQIRSLASIREAFDSCHFPAMLHNPFFQGKIFCMDDFKHKTAHDLYVICQRNYALTMKTYYTLKKNGVMFEDWEDKYLFEILPKKKTSLIWQKYEISTVPQLPACNKQQLEEIISAFSELSEFIKL